MTKTKQVTTINVADGGQRFRNFKPVFAAESFDDLRGDHRTSR